MPKPGELGALGPGARLVVRDPRPRRASRNSGFDSTIVTGKPATRASYAIPAPMIPPPTTTVRVVMPSLRQSAVGRLAPRRMNVPLAFETSSPSALRDRRLQVRDLAGEPDHLAAHRERVAGLAGRIVE